MKVESGVMRQGKLIGTGDLMQGPVASLKKTRMMLNRQVQEKLMTDGQGPTAGRCGRRRNFIVEVWVSSC